MSKNFVTLKTNKPHRARKTVILAGTEIKFDKYCMADVPERYVKDLVDAGLEIVDETELREFEQKRKEEPVAKTVVPDVDVADENAKLKKEIANLKEGYTALHAENKELRELNEKLSGDSLHKAEGDEPKEELDLKQMKHKEMQELCAQVNLPEAEWKGIKKTDDLRKYLQDKMNA